LSDIFDVISDAVIYDHISLCLELCQVIHHPAVEKLGLMESGLIDDYFRALRFNAFHDALQTAGPEVV